ncbi:MAG: FUSC family protein, partial [Muribaculaceae bacterium]|nr:FUSC family protein [Muribaculaceae bacterium]
SAPSPLRGNVLSQTGRLLNTLRLYDQAVPYLEEVIRIEQEESDTVNEVYDLQLLGNIYLRAENYTKSDSCFRQALSKSTNLPSYHAAKSRMSLAAVKYYTDDIDSARILIHPTIDAVDSIVRNSALGYAANIYLRAGLLDSAYFCAHEIVSGESLSQQHIGYQNLLNPKLRGFIHPDTLDRYIWEYRWLLEHFYDENAQNLAVNQQAFYNYQLHERDKDRAERSARVLRRSVAVCLFLLLILALTLCYLRIRSQARVIRLQQALHSLSELRRQLVASEARHDSLVSALTSPGSSSSDAKPAPTPSERELRLRLRDELTALSARSDARPALPDAIAGSEAYATALRYLDEDRAIPESDTLWERICEAVTAASPQFIPRLRLLTLATLTSLDLHTALLIKCGFRPSQMMILLGRSNGAVISRRETLGFKIFDKKTTVRTVDTIIRLL